MKTRSTFLNRNSRCFEFSNGSQTYELIKKIEGTKRKPMNLKLISIKSLKCFKNNH
jgi:hypothetical protein